VLGKRYTPVDRQGYMFQAEEQLIRVRADECNSSKVAGYRAGDGNTARNRRRLQLLLVAAKKLEEIYRVGGSGDRGFSLWDRNKVNVITGPGNITLAQKTRLRLELTLWQGLQIAGCG